MATRATIATRATRPTLYTIIGNTEIIKYLEFAEIINLATISKMFQTLINEIFGRIISGNMIFERMQLADSCILLYTLPNNDCNTIHLNNCPADNWYSCIDDRPFADDDDRGDLFF
jgi:hypothetical protein